MELKFFSTEYVDQYTTKTVVPAVNARRAAEVTSVEVRLSPLPEEEGGGWYADVHMQGYALTKAGKRNAQGIRELVSENDSEERWDIARAALLASVERHNVPLGEVDTPLARHTWAQWSEARANLF